MKMEKFTLSSEVVYTIKSAHGVQSFTGHDKLKEHGENLLGAFVDRLTGENTGNLFRDKQRNFEFLMNNRQELETIFAIQDAIHAQRPAPLPGHCNGIDCNCPDCYADENDN